MGQLEDIGGQPCRAADGLGEREDLAVDCIVADLARKSSVVARMGNGAVVERFRKLKPAQRLAKLKAYKETQ